MPTYVGRCHCQDVRFEVDANIDHVRVCDCTICAMRGGLMFRVPEEAMRLLTPLSNLTTYRWGSMSSVDYFCPTCGILPFRRPGEPTRTERLAGAVPFTGWTINTRCLEGFPIDSVPRVAIPGSQLDIEQEEFGRSFPSET